MGLSVLLLAGCGQKDYPIDEVFTKDSAFGVNANTTLDELKKKVELKEVKPNMYASNSAPKPYKAFNGYVYRVNSDKVCSVYAKNTLNKANPEAVSKLYQSLDIILESIYGDGDTRVHDKVNTHYWILSKGAYVVKLIDFKGEGIGYSFDFEERSSKPDGCQPS